MVNENFEKEIITSKIPVSETWGRPMLKTIELQVVLYDPSDIETDEFISKHDPTKTSINIEDIPCDGGIEDIENKIDAELVGHAGPLIPGEVFDRRAISMPRPSKRKKVYLSKRGGIPLLRKISLAV